MIRFNEFGQLVGTTALKDKLAHIAAHVRGHGDYTTDLKIFMGIESWEFSPDFAVPKHNRVVRMLHARKLLLHAGVPVENIICITGTDFFGEGYCALSISTHRENFVICPDKDLVQHVASLSSMGYTLTHQQSRGDNTRGGWVSFNIV